MPELYLLCGLSFAGKTTLAKALEQRFDFARVDIDAINTRRGVGLSGEPVAQDDWDKTYAEGFKELEAYLREGRSVLFDDANFMRAQRDFLRTIAAKYDASTHVIYLDVSATEARERQLRNRATRQRYDVRDDDFAHVVTNFEPPTPDEHVLRYNPLQSVDEWVEQVFLRGDN